MYLIRRGPDGYGLSVVYRGLDKYQGHDTGLFVSQVVAGGAAMRAGLRREDRVVRINKKIPRSIEEAVELMKRARSYIEMVIIRHEVSTLPRTKGIMKQPQQQHQQQQQQQQQKQDHVDTDDEEIEQHKKDVASKVRLQ